jgi:hypothetical protein
MTKCVICERRPAKENGFCTPCGNKIDAERNARRKNQPRHFLTYRGHVVGLFSDGNGTLKGQLLRRNPEKLPRKKTINLNIYCEGYTREIIKRFKACVLQLAHA